MGPLLKMSTAPGVPRRSPIQVLTGKGNEETVDLRISVMKPIHARWIVSALDKVAKDSAMVTHGWRLAGLLTE